MKLKDGFYNSSNGIGGLVLDMPTKRPKKHKKAKVKVGDMVRCEADEFIYPFRGYVKKIMSNSAIIRIENTMKCDRMTAHHKGQLAVALLRNIKVVNAK
ncbi:hypothetical protein ACX1Q6_002243 [Enterococcus hirae]|uniref:hypothetical protein n=1 Tax=Enterococcus hirae TaxID=1354 RepID=UPI0009BD9E30|nr:hypothetical protein [Enterococcus hirae]EMF0521985.1 hypothetical protein [Enterococcus hirae]OQO52371.1 hypothetical protein BH734_09220 [Enterococcus hirae]BDX48166.1 hypothetical protein L6E_25800 [Enterococcus hirae]